MPTVELVSLYTASCVFTEQNNEAGFESLINLLASSIFKVFNLRVMDATGEKKGNLTFWITLIFCNVMNAQPSVLSLGVQSM